MNPKFYKKILKNGITIIFEKRNLPVISVAFAVRNGAINENLEEKGISHFIEHMLYKGTPTRDSKKIAEEIEKNGGVLNGFTDDTITTYWCKMPSKHLKIALEVLSDMVKNPLFDERELEKERKIIFEEIKMNHDIPTHYVFNEIQKNLYDKPFSEGTLGSYESLNSIDRKKMKEKFLQIYQPNKIILCIVGDADFEEIVKFAEENFGNGRGEVPTFKIKKRNEIKVEEREGIDQANLVFAYHIPTAEDKKNYAAQVLSCLMAEGMSSRLFAEIREKRNLAYAVKGDCGIHRDFAYSFIYIGTSKENVGEVKRLILEEFEKVAEKLDEDELEQIKNQMIGNYFIGMEDSQMQMVNLLYNEIDGSAEEFYKFEENISEVRLEDVKEIARSVKNNFSFFALVPK